MLYWKKLQAALAYLAAGLGAAAGGAALVLGLFAAGAPGAGAATASPGMPRPSASAPAPSATPAADWTSPVRYPVVLDGWAFAQDEFNVLGNPLWRGRASREGEEIGVLIWQGQTHREAEERVGEISWREETGTGRVGFGTGTLSVRRGNSLLEEVELNQFLICQGENGGLRLDRHAATRWFTVVGPQGGARREPEAFADPAGEEILRGLLRAMLANPTPLFRGGMSEGTVSSLEAAVAGGPYIELAPTYTDGYGPGGWSVWVLQAHPGQAVSFRLWLAALRYRVTTAGIESGCEQAAMHGRRVWIGETEGRFTPAGPAELEIPALPGPERLTVSCEGVVYAPDAEPGTLGANPHTLGYIYLRWNRPEEEWLPTGRFPLAPRLPPEATPAAAVPIVLADLEAAYQPDLAGWFTTWGQPYVGQPEALALLPLADLDLAAYPHLAAARAAGRADWLVEAARGLALLDRNTEPAGPREALAARVAARLAEEGRSLAANQHLQPYTEEIPDGWHGTKKALWLALLWERFPGLREGNPLERVLDFWSAAIARNPAPAEDINNRERDRSPQTLARAVAALHLGGRALARPAWAQAGQAVLAELGRVFDEAAPEAKAEAAAWYGRAAALAGDQPALARVQRWLLTALAGDEAGFAAYRAAPFAARLGLLAVLRGRGDGLAPQEP